MLTAPFVLYRLENPEHIGIPLAIEAADSKFFPVSNSAKEVRDRLVRACLRTGVTFRWAPQTQTRQNNTQAMQACLLGSNMSFACIAVCPH